MLPHEDDPASSTTFGRDGASRSRNPAHDRLAVFLGTWQVRGHNAPVLPGFARTPVTGQVTYAWLPGGLFLTCRWARLFGDAEHAGLAVIGYDAGEHAYVARHFDNLGHARSYRVTTAERVWTYEGTFERARLVVTPDGRSFTETWESTRDGRRWAPRCELIASKR